MKTVASLLSLLAASAGAEVRDGLEQLIAAIVAGRGRLPPLALVQDGAERALRLEPEGRAEDWSDRARDRGWVPQVDLRVGTDSALDVREPGRLSEVYQDRRRFDARVGLRWGLGDVVFSDVELRVNRERLARSAAVRLARERATKIYFERLKVELLLLGEDPDPSLHLEAARLDGLLLALTGDHSDRRTR